MKEKIFKVYCYTNKQTDEKYIGVTCKTLKQRAGKNGRDYLRSNTKFAQAITKYGWDSFDVSILDTTTDDREASKLERYYIEMFESYKDGIGYNKNRGGAVPTIKCVMQFDVNGNYITTYDRPNDASKNVGVPVTQIIECCNKKSKTAGGFVWRYEKEYNGSFDEKELTPFSGERRVDQLSTNGVFIRTFNSAKEAQQETGAQRSKICMCCKGLRKTAGGYCWRYTDGFGLKDIYNPVPSVVRKVAQYSLSGDLIEIYESQSDAHRKTGISASMIATCCDGKRDVACGYIWKYILN